MARLHENLPEARIVGAGTLARPAAVLGRARDRMQRARPAARNVAAYAAGLFPLVAVMLLMGLLMWVVALSGSP